MQTIPRHASQARADHARHAARRSQAARLARRSRLVTDVEMMIRCGAGRDEIASRLNRSWQGVERALYRESRHDLVAASHRGTTPWVTERATAARARILATA